MALTEQEKNIVRNLRSIGKTDLEIQRAIANNRAGMFTQQDIPKLDQQQIKEPSAIERATTTIKSATERAGQSITGEGEFAGQTPIRRGTQAVAEITGIAPQVAVDVAPKPIRSVIEKVTGVIGQGFKSLTDKIADTEVFKGASGNLVVNKDGTYEFVPTETKAVEEALGTTQAGGQIAGDILIAEGGARGARATTKQAGNVSEVVAQRASRLADDIAQEGTTYKQKLMEFVAPDADDVTKTILKESKPSDIDRYVKLQERVAVDPRAITPYEYVGDQMSQATKLLQQELNRVGKLKSDIIKPLNKGLDPFSPKTVLDDLTSLKNRTTGADTSVIDRIINQAKSIKTKQGADKFIDDIQDLVYTSNRSMTIPAGSALDKQLRSIIGKFNNELKNSLPKQYSALNARYSNLNKVTQALNTALGEVIEGVSTRGGSLVKQFFSPNGRKAKELFDYIKKNTGIDLAKEATIARYIMELYGDPRARTLLGGEIPTSVSGVLNKAIDFAVEKTGLGKSVQEAQRKGAIEKAKRMTKPSQ